MIARRLSLGELGPFISYFLFPLDFSDISSLVWTNYYEGNKLSSFSRIVIHHHNLAQRSTSRILTLLDWRPTGQVENNYFSLVIRIFIARNCTTILWRCDVPGPYLCVLSGVTIYLLNLSGKNLISVHLLSWGQWTHFPIKIEFKMLFALIEWKAYILK